MTLEERIQDSVAHSKEKYLAKRAQQEEYKTRLKEGRKFYHENQDEIQFFVLGPMDETRIVAAYAEDKHRKVNVAFAYLNAKDSYSERVARGVLGYKLLTGSTDQLIIPTKIQKNVWETSKLISYSLFIGLLNKTIQAPSWVLTALTKEYM